MPCKTCRLFIYSFYLNFFTDEMSESRQTHVTLHDIDPQALEQLVQYAYTAEIVVGEGNVQVCNSMLNSCFKVCTSTSKLWIQIFLLFGAVCLNLSKFFVWFVTSMPCLNNQLGKCHTMALSWNWELCEMRISFHYTFHLVTIMLYFPKPPCFLWINNIWSVEEIAREHLFHWVNMCAVSLYVFRPP